MEEEFDLLIPADNPLGFELLELKRVRDDLAKCQTANADAIEAVKRKYRFECGAAESCTVGIDPQDFWQPVVRRPMGAADGLTFVDDKGQTVTLS